MAENGYVYVLVNPSMEGLIKVGKTTREPKERAVELSKATGVPTPFFVAYEEYFNNCTKAEEFVHTYLGQKGYRLAPNREFFEVPTKEAIDAIIECKRTMKDIACEGSHGITEEENYINPWADIEKEACEYYYGSGTKLQDDREALLRFKSAYSLGSPFSCQQLASMYMLGQGCTVDLDIALEYLKEGVKRRNYECYGKMMEIYFEKERIENALKCWDLYIEKNDILDVFTCVIYMRNAWMFNIPVKHRDQLFLIKDRIIDWEKYYISRIDHENILKYMEYVFSVSPEQQIMCGQDYYNYLIQQRKNEAVEEQKDEKNTKHFIWGVAAVIAFLWLAFAK